MTSIDAPPPAPTTPALVGKLQEHIDEIKESATIDDARQAREYCYGYLVAFDELQGLDERVWDANCRAIHAAYVSTRRLLRNAH